MYTFVYYLKSFICLSANKSFHDNSINHFIFIFHVNFDKIIPCLTQIKYLNLRLNIYIYIIDYYKYILLLLLLLYN